MWWDRKRERDGESLFRKPPCIRKESRRKRGCSFAKRGSSPRCKWLTKGIGLSRDADLHVDDVTDVTALLILARRDEAACETANPTFFVRQTVLARENSNGAEIGKAYTPCAVRVIAKIIIIIRYLMRVRACISLTIFYARVKILAFVLLVVKIKEL